MWSAISKPAALRRFWMRCTSSRASPSSARSGVTVVSRPPGDPASRSAGGPAAPPRPAHTRAQRALVHEALVYQRGVGLGPLRQVDAFRRVDVDGADQVLVDG